MSKNVPFPVHVRGDESSAHVLDPGEAVARSAKVNVPFGKLRLRFDRRGQATGEMAPPIFPTPQSASSKSVEMPKKKRS